MIPSSGPALYLYKVVSWRISNSRSTADFKNLNYYNNGGLQNASSQNSTDFDGS